MSSNKPPRVLIVDDSAFMRRMTSQIIGASGEFTVVGTARNGYDALKQVHALDPDIVTLDVDMPELDGLSALGYIMSETPRPVVMLSAGTTSTGHEATLRALELGAVDFVLKPSGSISLDLVRISGRLRRPARGAARGCRGESHRFANASPGGISWWDAGRCFAARDAGGRDRVVDRWSSGARSDRPAAHAKPARGRPDRPAHARRIHQEHGAAARFGMPTPDR